MKNNKLISALLSILIAFALWLYVITTVSPGSKDTIYDIPVVFEYESVMNERGLMITSNDNIYIDLELSGNRSDLIKLNKNNITIKVDLSKVYEPGNKELDYTISYPSDVPSGAFTELNRYPGTVNITVEKKLTKPVEVQVNFFGNAKEGFIADTENRMLDYPTINVTGPSSVVELIDHARIDIDLTDMTESISENYRYTLCDEEGTPIDVAMITTDVAEVHLDVKIQRWKEIPLTLNLTYGGGALETNTKIEIDPLTIRVSGSELLLEDLNEINLGSIDLSTLEENLTEVYTITLPEGVTNLSEKTEATVTITFVGLTIKEFEVTQIEVINLPEGLDYELMNQLVKVRLRGATHLINQIKPEDIVVTIDFTGKEIGSFTIKATITIKGDQYASVGAVGSYSIPVTLKEVEEEATEG